MEGYQSSPVEVTTIYTDGSCIGGGTSMGAGFVILPPTGDIHTSGIALGPGTNNRAELSAIYLALLNIEKYPSRVVIYTDSEYCIGALTKNWKTTKNLELLDKIKVLMREFESVHFKWVRGHTRNEFNEMADRLATEASARGIT